MDPHHVKAITERDENYTFPWCKDCAALHGCYYQHGDKSAVPLFLDPDCAKGPME